MAREVRIISHRSGEVGLAFLHCPARVIVATATCRRRRRERESRIEQPASRPAALRNAAHVQHEEGGRRFTVPRFRRWRATSAESPPPPPRPSLGHKGNSEPGRMRLAG